MNRLTMTHEGQSYNINTLVQMICMSQIAENYNPKILSLNKGLRVWGEKGMTAVNSDSS